MMRLYELVLLADDRSSALLDPYRRNPAMDKSPAELILKKKTSFKHNYWLKGNLELTRITWSTDSDW